jgi:hypothetical protein
MGPSARRTCRQVFSVLLPLQLLLVAPWRQGGTTAARALNFTRQDFPRDFVFGAGTSAYQVTAYLYILTTHELHMVIIKIWLFGRGLITQLTEKFL